MVLRRAETLKWGQVVLVGISKPTEIACRCALEVEIKVIANNAPQAKLSKKLGVPFGAGIEAVSGGCGGLILTEINVHQENVNLLGDDDYMLTVLVPYFLERSLFEVDKQTAEAS